MYIYIYNLQRDDVIVCRVVKAAVIKSFVVVSGSFVANVSLTADDVVVILSGEPGLSLFVVTFVAPCTVELSVSESGVVELAVTALFPLDKVVVALGPIFDNDSGVLVFNNNATVVSISV